MLMPQLDECELGKEQPLSLLSSVISLKLGGTRALMRDLIFHVLNYLHQAQGLQKDAQMHESHPI
jgi:hypothetical protein